MSVLERTVQRLGTTDDGGYVVVEAEVKVQSGTWGTVTHGAQITDPLELSISGMYFEKGARRDNPSSVGQISQYLDDITTPAPGWTLAEIRELRQIWDRWHLNAMNARCVHMPPFEDLLRDEEGRASTTANVCPETGYRYGTAWLVEPLPESVIERVCYLMRDRSQALYKARGYDAQGRAVE